MTFGQCIQVYKKKFIHKRKCTNKVIIFDLDETLGCFTDLEALWGVIDKNVLPYNNIYLTKQLLFNALYCMKVFFVLIHPKLWFASFAKEK